MNFSFHQIVHAKIKLANETFHVQHKRNMSNCILDILLAKSPLSGTIFYKRGGEIFLGHPVKWIKSQEYLFLVLLSYKQPLCDIMWPPTCSAPCSLVMRRQEDYLSVEKCQDCGQSRATLPCLSWLVNITNQGVIHLWWQNNYYVYWVFHLTSLNVCCLWWKSRYWRYHSLRGRSYITSYRLGVGSMTHYDIILIFSGKFNGINGSNVRKLNSDLFSILIF